MNRKPYYPVLFSLIISLMCMHCTLDEGNPGSTDPALTLQVQSELSVIHLNWTPVKVTGFKEYIILQSSGDIPNSPTPIVNQDVTVLTRINEVNVTTFSTTNTLFSPTSCYKLYCSVDDRFLYSGTVCVNQTPITLQGFFDRVDHDPALPQIAMFDRVNINLVAFNDTDGTIFNSIPESNLSFPQLDLSVFEGANRLFSYDLSTSQIRKYTFPQLSLQNQKFVGESIFGGVAWKNFVFISLQNSTSGFQILNANSLATIDSKPGIISSRNIAIFDGDPVVVLEIGDAVINRYEINDLGKVTKTDQFNGGAPQPGTQNTCDFNADYYIGGRFSTLVNKDAEMVTSLESGINAFAQIVRFSDDGTKVLQVTSNNNVFTLDLFDITNLPAAVKIKSYNVPVATYSDLYIRDHVINLIGVSFNSSSPQTFFLQFPE